MHEYGQQFVQRDSGKCREQSDYSKQIAKFVIVRTTLPCFHLVQKYKVQDEFKTIN